MRNDFVLLMKIDVKIDVHFVTLCELLASIAVKKLKILNEE